MTEITTNHIIFIALTALWTLPWKGVALWKSAKNENKHWFIILLLINTLGILDILYIFIFGKKRKEEGLFKH